MAVARRRRARGVLGARRSDAGFSLVELMVAIVIFTIIGGIVTLALVSLNRTTRTATASVTTQSQLDDVTQRVQRDISAASDIYIATPSELELGVVVGSHCTLIDYAASGTTVTSKAVTLAASTCPSSASDGTVIGTVVTTIVYNLSNANLFTYLDSNNNTFTPTADTLANIARVGYLFSAKVQGRTGDLVLKGSADPFTPGGTGSLGPGAGGCPAPTLSGPAYVSTPSVAMSWTEPVAATGYLLVRDGTTIDRPTSGTTTSYTDTGVSYGGTYLYFVYSLCSGGAQSQPSNGVVVTVVPASPVLTCSRSFNPSGNGLDTATVTWPAVTGATGYTVQWRDSTNGTVWNALTDTTGTSVSNNTLAPGDTYQFEATATDTAGSSTQSNIATCVPKGSGITEPPLTLTGTLVNQTTCHYTWAWGNPPPTFGENNTYDLWVSSGGAYSKAASVSNSTFSYDITNGACYYDENLWAYVTTDTAAGQTIQSNTVLLSPRLPSLSVSVSSNWASTSGTPECTISWSWSNGVDPIVPSGYAYQIWGGNSWLGGSYTLLAQFADPATHSWIQTGGICDWGKDVYYEVLAVPDASSPRWYSGSVGLNAGQSVKQNQPVISADGRTELILQGDGNLVMYQDYRPMWATGTSGTDAANGTLSMQTDGNLVLYGQSGTALWAASREGAPLQAGAHFWSYNNSLSCLVNAASTANIWCFGDNAYGAANSAPPNYLTLAYASVSNGPGPFPLTLSVDGQGPGAADPYDSVVSGSQGDSVNAGTASPSTDMLNLTYCCSAGATQYTWTVAGGASHVGTATSISTSVGSARTGMVDVYATAANGLTRYDTQGSVPFQTAPTQPQSVALIQECYPSRNVPGNSIFIVRGRIQAPWGFLSGTGIAAEQYVSITGYNSDGTVGATYNSGWYGISSPNDIHWFWPHYVIKGGSSKYVYTITDRDVDTNVSNVYQQTAAMTLTFTSQSLTGWDPAGSCPGSDSAWMSGWTDAYYVQTNYPASWDNGFERFGHTTWASSRMLPGNNSDW